MTKQLKQCKSFALDLMHLSTNEINEIKDLAGLKAHLAGCRVCQEKLGKLKEVDVFSFLARPRSAKYQRKMTALLGQVKAETDPVRKNVAKGENDIAGSPHAISPDTMCRDNGADRPPIKPIPGEQPIDDERHIGSAAGKIYRALKDNGKMPYPLIRQKTEIWGEPFYEAMGWLAREKKIRRTRVEQTFYAALAPLEMERHQPQA